MQVIIRKFEDKDAIAVSAMLVSCYDSLAKSDGLSKDQVACLHQKRASLNHLREHSRKNQIYVAERDNYILGMISFGACEIKKLYVDPRHQRMNIGRKLLEQAEKIIAAGAHERIILATFIKSPLEFYKKMGYELVDERKSVLDVFANNTVYLLNKHIKKAQEV